MKNKVKEPSNDNCSHNKFTISMLSPVGWFNIRLLIVTGIKSLITKLVDSRSPTREMLAALDNESPKYKSADTATSLKETWIDYVADIGDGFSATHSISWLMARDFLFLDKPEIEVEQPIPANAQSEVPKDIDSYKNCTNILQGGSTTIFGGDQVYPIASQQEYEQRTFSPYFAARPWGKASLTNDNEYEKRQLYAIPGNHDWYDGLVSFVRRFCQPGRWMGCWQSQQKRSYFSIQLSHGFWLWGVDMTTDDDIDPPQLQYFKDQSNKLDINDQVILCVPKPVWNTYVDEDKYLRKESHAWEKIEIIEKIITKNEKINATVAAILAGDEHHYAHHIRKIEDSSIPDTHLITCGGGGAYMLGTTAISEDLSLPDFLTNEGTNKKVTTTFHKAFPSKEESKKIRLGVYKLFINFKIFCTTIAAVLLGLIWLIHTSSIRMSLVEGNDIDTGFLSDKLIFSSQFPIVIKDLILILTQNPGVLTMVILICSAFILFTFSGKNPQQISKINIIAIGFIHFILQFFITIFIANILYNQLTSLDNLFLQTIVFIVLGLFLGWIINGLLISIYIATCSYLFSLHEEELYSSQSIEDWKCFLRMRINSKGLTIYPIGLRKTVKQWEVSKNKGDIKNNSSRKTFSSWIKNQMKSSVEVSVRRGTSHIFHPIEPISPELIEKPIKIKSRKIINNA